MTAFLRSVGLRGLLPWLGLAGLGWLGWNALEPVWGLGLAGVGFGSDGQPALWMAATRTAVALGGGAFVFGVFGILGPDSDAGRILALARASSLGFFAAALVLLAAMCGQPWRVWFLAVHPVAGEGVFGAVAWLLCLAWLASPWSCGLLGMRLPRILPEWMRLARILPEKMRLARVFPEKMRLARILALAVFAAMACMLFGPSVALLSLAGVAPVGLLAGSSWQADDRAATSRILGLLLLLAACAIAVSGVSGVSGVAGWPAWPGAGFALVLAAAGAFCLLGSLGRAERLGRNVCDALLVCLVAAACAWPEAMARLPGAGEKEWLALALAAAAGLGVAWFVRPTRSVDEAGE